MLTSVAGVTEAAVFVETNKLGVQEVWAAVVSPEKVTVEALQAHCRERVPAAFIPSHVVTLDALPLTTPGKLDRPRLKQMALEAAARDQSQA